MARRLKSDKPALKQIENWGYANEYVRRVGDLQRDIIAYECLTAADINTAKKKLETDVTPLQKEIKRLVESLEAFATVHKDDFGKDRSRKLNFGLLGWRKSTSVIIKKTTLEKIKTFFAKEKAMLAFCIIRKETVSKEALAKLTDEELASVGARREVKDDFFVEPDLPEAVDYCE